MEICHCRTGGGGKGGGVAGKGSSSSTPEILYSHTSLEAPPSHFLRLFGNENVFDHNNEKQSSIKENYDQQSDTKNFRNN